MTAIITAIISAFIVIIDQVIKYFVLGNLQSGDNVPFIGNLLTLTYVENRGAVFGIMQNMSWLFAIITVIMIAVFFYVIIKKKITNKLFLTSVILIIGGGVGNLIDRVFRGFVIDYLQLSFFPPVCNFADYCITIGAVLMIIFVMFLGDKKDEDTPKRIGSDE